MRVCASFTYWKPEPNSDDDEKAENDNRKIVPSGRRLRSHRTMSALSVLHSGGRGMTWQMLGTPDKSASHWMTARSNNPVGPSFPPSHEEFHGKRDFYCRTSREIGARCAFLRDHRCKNVIVLILFPAKRNFWFFFSFAREYIDIDVCTIIRTCLTSLETNLTRREL